MDKLIQLQKDGINLFPINATVLEDENRKAIKYADGTLICTYSSDLIKTAITTVRGSLFSSTSISIPQYLINFVEPPVITYSIDQNLTDRNMFFLSPQSGYSTISKPANVYIVAAESQSLHATAGYFINIIAIGKWK